MAFGTVGDDSARARLARNLRAKRAEQGLSQEALGARATLTRSAAWVRCPIVEAPPPLDVPPPMSVPITENA